MDIWHRILAEVRFVFNIVKEAVFHPLSVSVLDSGTGKVIFRGSSEAYEEHIELANECVKSGRLSACSGPEKKKMRTGERKRHGGRSESDIVESEAESERH